LQEIPETIQQSCLARAGLSGERNQPFSKLHAIDQARQRFIMLPALAD
jgi:hypothetical protein